MTLKRWERLCYRLHGRDGVVCHTFERIHEENTNFQQIFLQKTRFKRLIFRVLIFNFYRFALILLIQSSLHIVDLLLFFGKNFSFSLSMGVSISQWKCRIPFGSKTASSECYNEVQITTERYFYLDFFYLWVIYKLRIFRDSTEVITLYASLTVWPHFRLISQNRATAHAYST